MKSLRIVFVALSVFLISCVSIVFAKTEFTKVPAGKYEVDLTHANIVWTVSHFGLSDYVARFTDFDITIDYNPDNIEKSKVTASIDPMSIQTAYPNAEEKDFDNILATDKSWFNAGEFASINFESTSITMTGEDSALMKGTLRFLGVSKPIELKVTFNGAMQRHPFVGKPVMGFSATTTIDRTEWGMTKYAPQVGAEVEVELSGEFIKSND